jgi:hypothetical protein
MHSKLFRTIVTLNAMPNERWLIKKFIEKKEGNYGFY